MIDEQVDILIIGAGLTGSILQLALLNKGFSSLIIDENALNAKIDSDFDARALALSPASARIMQMLSIWPLIEGHATPIAKVHVSERACFGSTNITSKAQQPLGYVVEMQHIYRAIDQLTDKNYLLSSARLNALDMGKGIARISTPTRERLIQARLIIAADGTESAARRLSELPVKIKDYRQFALVANIGLADAHQNVAYERFTSSGPLALLPMTDKRLSLVWALSPERAKEMQGLDEKIFLHCLQKTFGYRLGRFIRVGKRVIFPLRQVTMTQKVAWPLVFIGNAAHTLHPVAGQGFNLGLRDVASLAQCILQHGLSKSMLFSYQQMRQHDEWAITHFTNSLIDIFTSRLPGMTLARNLGLLAIDNVAVLKRCLTHYASGFAGITPDLVCGIGLEPKELK